MDDYLDNQVITTVSAVDNTDPAQDKLFPGEQGTFTVTITNGDAATGFRLTDVLYHVE